MRNADLIRVSSEAGIALGTPAKLRKLQRDLYRQLEESNISVEHYRGFEHCGTEACGRSVCSEACFFGACRSRIREIPTIFGLLKDNGPVCEVRILRDSWNRPVGSLCAANIPAAQQLNRRALDKLFCPDLIAVGMFKVSLHWGAPSEGWICEIHELVAGANKQDLEQAIVTSGNEWVREVDDLGAALSRLFRLEVRSWNPFGDKHPGYRLDSQYRAELYQWLLDLRPDARMIRYGCNRHWKKLTKKPQTIRPKTPRKRPGPRRERFDLSTLPDEKNPNSMLFKPKQRPDPWRRRNQQDDNPGYYTRDIKDRAPKRRRDPGQIDSDYYTEGLELSLPKRHRRDRRRRNK